jgi:hypothetical protein
LTHNGTHQQNHFDSEVDSLQISQIVLSLALPYRENEQILAYLLSFLLLHGVLISKNSSTYSPEELL